MSRRAFDFYPTPTWATRELLKRIDPGPVVLEPCSGAHDIADELAMDERVRCLFTNDLDTNQRSAQQHGDATDPAWWAEQPYPGWVITNPPFSVAHKILPLAWKHARCGVAMLLRLSYLEPCEGRGVWMSENPPHKLIVLPRISFTGDGGTDMVTCAWFVWDKYCFGQSIEIVTANDERQPSLLDATA